MVVDFYSQVPKDLAGNLRYRIDIRKRARKDLEFRNALIAACKHDVLFFFSAFCWLYEPRPRVVNGVKLPPIIPFIPWDHQVPAIRKIKEFLGFEDLGAEKSRGEGASWISVLLALHDWLFEDMTAIGLVSRTEDAVDSPDDPDSLMWKLDWELTQLPRWMAGVKDVDFKRTVQDHNLKNLRNGSTITGYSATGDVASGGRKKWFLMDELAKFPRGPDAEAMASTQHVTNSRLVVSTPKGSEGAYFQWMHEPSSMVKIILDWKQNPSRNRGLYTLVAGVPVAVDPVNNPLSENYDPPTKEVLDMFSRLRKRGFKLENTERSPWYDHECDRGGATPQNIAQELDRDYGGSMFRFFGAEFFNEADKTTMKPRTTGMLTYHPETLEPEFNTIENGQLHVWCPLDVRNQPPMRQYAIGADVSTGLGGSHTSNSAAYVIDLTAMEQVASFASNTMVPEDFADFCISMSKWFNNAYLAWEHNGPGSAFTKRVLAQGYPNIYRRTSQWKQSKKRTKEAGWWTDERTKPVLLGELLRTVKTGELKLRCGALVQECGQYVYLGGKPEHVSAASTEDDSSKNAAHGDRVIAAGVALQAVRDRPITTSGPAWMDVANGRIPQNSIAARQAEYEESLRKDKGLWDNSTTWGNNENLARR